MNVGVGRACITPREPIGLAGYADRTGKHTGVYQDIFAKALVLGEGPACVGYALRLKREFPGRPLRGQPSVTLAKTHDLRARSGLNTTSQSPRSALSFGSGGTSTILIRPNRSLVATGSPRHNDDASDNQLTRQTKTV